MEQELIIISDEEMEDIMKIVKSLEELGDRELVKQLKMKQKKEDFFQCY